MPIKVAYLFGAGASQGELSQNGFPKSILMPDLVYEIARKIHDDKIASLADVSNELVSGADIEHLITLYEASGTREHNEIAKKLKTLFRQKIQERINELGSSFFPTLFASLIDMHSIEGLDEKLVLIMTTNYEDLIEKAMQHVAGGINYTIKTMSKDKHYSVKEDTVPILKLHGSFNWKSEFPVTIQSKITREEDVIWIPPGVVKRREYYPFNVIWGKARELLECDILRIIGSSLSGNDWELVSLIHTTQQLRTDGKPPYTIELIDYPEKCEKLKDQYNYLNIKTILEIPEVQEYIVRIYTAKDIGRREISEEKIKGIAKYISDKETNIFSFWLRAKGEKLYYDDISITTENKYFEQFVMSGL